MDRPLGVPPPPLEPTLSTCGSWCLSAVARCHRQIAGVATLLAATTKRCLPSCSTSCDELLWDRVRVGDLMRLAKPSGLVAGQVYSELRAVLVCMLQLRPADRCSAGEAAGRPPSNVPCDSHAIAYQCKVEVGGSRFSLYHIVVLFVPGTIIF